MGVLAISSVGLVGQPIGKLIIVGGVIYAEGGLGTSPSRVRDVVPSQPSGNTIIAPSAGVKLTTTGARKNL